MTLCQLAASLDNSEGPENPVQKLNSQEDRFVKQEKKTEIGLFCHMQMRLTFVPALRVGSRISALQRVLEKPRKLQQRCGWSQKEFNDM
jgi:hypothetical protein